MVAIFASKGPTLVSSGRGKDERTVEQEQGNKKQSLSCQGLSKIIIKETVEGNDGIIICASISLADY